MIFAKKLEQLDMEEKNLNDRLREIQFTRPQFDNLNERAGSAIENVRSLHKEIQAIDADASINFSKAVVESIGTEGNVHSDDLSRSMKEAYQAENARLELRIENLIQKVAELTDQRDRIQDELTQLKQQATQEVKVLHVDDLVKNPSGDIAVVDEISPSGAIAIRAVEGEFQGVIEYLGREQLKWVASPTIPSAEATADAIANNTEIVAPEEEQQVVEPREMLEARKAFATLPNKKAAESITWQQVQSFCLKEARLLGDLIMEVQAESNKIPFETFKESLPKLLANYVKETGDRTDFEWLPEPLVKAAIAILEPPKNIELPFSVGDQVEAFRMPAKVWEKAEITGIHYGPEGQFKWFKMKSLTDSEETTKTFNVLKIERLRNIEEQQPDLIQQAITLQDAAEIPAEINQDEINTQEAA